MAIHEMRRMYSRGGIFGTREISSKPWSRWMKGRSGAPIAAAAISTRWAASAAPRGSVPG